ncbi:MAG: Maf family protein [Bacteroidota bacterium]|nr:Maf family protein [Bacteroidota bacterium]
MILRVPLVLASASPRRSSLLDAMGLNPLVQSADVDETPLPDEDPSTMAERLAKAKAESVAEDHPEALVLGSDTTVVLDGSILGKPDTEQEAVSMLSSLSNRSHTVISSLALVHTESKRSFVASERTTVFFDALTPEQIQRYVASGSPMDKAGAYGIQDDQGAFFVRRIEGDYYTVMGLPLNLFHRMVVRFYSDLAQS